MPYSLLRRFCQSRSFHHLLSWLKSVFSKQIMVLKTHKIYTDKDITLHLHQHNFRGTISVVFFLFTNEVILVLFLGLSSSISLFYSRRTCWRPDVLRAVQTFKDWFRIVRASRRVEVSQIRWFGSSRSKVCSTEYLLTLTLNLTPIIILTLTLNLTLIS